MTKFQLLLETLGAAGSLCTLLALFFPKGSRVGYILAKLGADLKGHTTQAEPPEEP